MKTLKRYHSISVDEIQKTVHVSRKLKWNYIRTFVNVSWRRSCFLTESKGTFFDTVHWRPISITYRHKFVESMVYSPDSVLKVWNRFFVYSNTLTIGSYLVPFLINVSCICLLPSSKNEPITVTRLQHKSLIFWNRKEDLIILSIIRPSNLKTFIFVL